MSDVELLFVILAVVYAIECSWWLDRRSVAFRSCFGKRFRLIQPSSFVGNSRGGFIFTHPLPPLGVALAAHELPLSIASGGVLVGSSSGQSQKFIPFDAAREFSAAGKKISGGGSVLLKAGSPGEARHVVQILERLRALDKPRRAPVLEKIIEQSLDNDQVRKRWERFRQKIKSLRVLCNGLFVYLFMFAPVLIGMRGLASNWPWLLGGILALTLPIALSFNRVHKELYAEAVEERFTHFLIVLLSPATAIRAHDVLSRSLLVEFHPLAVAKAFCTPSEFRAFAGEFVRNLRYAHGLEDDSAESDPADIAEWSRALWLRKLETWLSQQGMNPQELTGPPVPADDTCFSYCPRCLAQFTTEKGSCADCGGIPLVPFSFGAGRSAVPPAGPLQAPIAKERR
ncbi:MAG: hypothetical protein C5B50_18385 [Verrucomicrobia bacterium]|nr:MAG: hypothetical protein C5B50_18385 [Verrucomicrobiota bacterium]